MLPCLQDPYKIRKCVFLLDWGLGVRKYMFHPKGYAPCRRPPRAAATDLGGPGCADVLEWFWVVFAGLGMFLKPFGWDLKGLEAKVELGKLQKPEL